MENLETSLGAHSGGRFLKKSRPPLLDWIVVVWFVETHTREYRATMAEENLHHSGPV